MEYNNINNFINNSKLINIFVNIITILIILYFIYQFILDYKKEQEFHNNNVSTYTDIDNFIIQYNDSDLCKLFNRLNKKDKEFLYHLINSQRLKYKEENPKLTKRLKSLKTQLFYNMIITFLLKQKTSAMFDSLKHNTLFAFFSGF